MPIEGQSSTPIDIQDEARIGQKNGSVRQWARRGTRPRQPADQRYKSAYLFGAICSARGVGAALALPFADTEAMQLHIDEISRHGHGDGCSHDVGRPFDVTRLAARHGCRDGQGETPRGGDTRRDTARHTAMVGSGEDRVVGGVRAGWDGVEWKG